jgi:GT2 family glycosyltransferase
MRAEREPMARADEAPRLPEPTDPVLTVAVLSYDGRHLLEGILPSLAAQEFRDFRVVVVDNGSSDGTAAWLAEHWPQVTVVALPENVGVTPALNVCVRAADTEFVGLFNNDLELDPAALGALVGALRDHPNAASAGGKLVDFHDRTVLDGAGDTFAWAGTGHRRGHGERDRGQYDEPGEFFGACGGAAVYRRAAFDVVGPFDEQFFAFFEDVDWAFRAQLAGFGCRYVPGAVVYHMGSATLGKGMSDFTQYHLWRNAVWLVAKDYPPAALLRHFPRIVYVQAAQLAGALHERRLGLWARAMRDALVGLPRALRRRRAVQRTRRRSVRELEAIVAAAR